MENYFITTAIDYASGSPHIGHAYEKIIADVLARWHRLNGFNVWFGTGTDEHGLKILRNAEKAGKTPKDFVDGLAEEFKQAWKALNISFDDFIRTTEKRHANTVQAFFEKVKEKEDIYKSTYSGLYCVDCETYYISSDLLNGTDCPTHKKPCEQLSEESYFFKMNKYQNDLVKYFKENPGFVLPKERKNEILNRLKEDLHDLSISRTTFKWGIPFPGDEKHILYVWVEALVNYLTTINYPEKEFEEYWPALHIIGKDILWHHSVIWPTLLMSAGLKLPSIRVHGFITVNGEKISKSLGNAIDPINLVEKYSADAIRYYLLREIPFGQDGDFNEQALKTRINSDLGNDLGNLLQRTLALIEKKSNNIIPTAPKDTIVVKKNQELFDKIDRQLNALEFHRALETIWVFLAELNKMVNETEPWKLEANSKEINYVLSRLANSLAFSAFLLHAFMPSTSQVILEQLGLKNIAFNKENFDKAKSVSLIPENTKIGVKKALFPRIK